MAGTHTLTTAHTGSLVSGQPCHPRADGRNVFDCLFDLRLINKLSRPAVRTSTQFDLDILIDLIGLATECAGMSLLASGPLGRRDTLFFLQPEKEQPADARRAARLRAPLPTPGCGWFSLPIAQRAKHFERLNAPVPATSRLAARPVA